MNSLSLRTGPWRPSWGPGVSYDYLHWALLTYLERLSWEIELVCLVILV